MKSLLTAIAAAGVLLVSAASAQAMTVFDLTGSNANSSSMDFSSGGIGLTAYSQQEVGNNLSAAGRLTQTTGGLGVRRGLFDSNQLDSVGTDEAILFVFNQTVRLDAVNFSHFGQSDDFSFYFDTDNNGSLDTVFLNNSSDPFAFATDYIGTTFAIGASGTGDRFRIKELTVSAVPLPAALPLYGAGLAVIGFVGWRKRRKAAAQA